MDEQGARPKCCLKLNGVGNKCWWFSLDSHISNSFAARCQMSSTQMPLIVLQAEVLQGTLTDEFLCALPCFQVQFSHPAVPSDDQQGTCAFIALMIGFPQFASTSARHSYSSAIELD